MREPSVWLSACVVFSLETWQLQVIRWTVACPTYFVRIILGARYSRKSWLNLLCRKHSAGGIGGCQEFKTLSGVNLEKCSCQGGWCYLIFRRLRFIEALFYQIFSGKLDVLMSDRSSSTERVIDRFKKTISGSCYGPQKRIALQNLNRRFIGWGYLISSWPKTFFLQL